MSTSRILPKNNLLCCECYFHRVSKWNSEKKVTFILTTVGSKAAERLWSWEKWHSSRLKFSSSPNVWLNSCTCVLKLHTERLGGAELMPKSAPSNVGLSAWERMCWNGARSVNGGKRSNLIWNSNSVMQRRGNDTIVAQGFLIWCRCLLCLVTAGGTDVNYVRSALRSVDC